MQAADLEQFLFGSASAATDDFGKELTQAGDQSEVIITINQPPALFLSYLQQAVSELWNTA